MKIKSFSHKAAKLSINDKVELFEVCGTYDSTGPYIEIVDFRLVIKDTTHRCEDLLCVPGVLLNVIEQVRAQL